VRPEQSRPYIAYSAALSLEVTDTTAALRAGPETTDLRLSIDVSVHRNQISFPLLKCLGMLRSPRRFAEEATKTISPGVRNFLDTWSKSVV